MSQSEDEKTPALLHVLPQQVWHDEAIIIGTRPALLMLRSAIDNALDAGAAAIEAMPTDGEGYWLAVVCASEQDMANVPLGYAGVEIDQPIPASIEDRIIAAISHRMAPL